MKHLNSPLRYWPLGFLAVAIVMAGIAAVPPPPIQRNVITTNTPSVVTFGGIAQVNDTILAWDTVDNQFVDMFIGANLTYTHATHTLSAAAGGGQTPWLQTEDAAGWGLTNLFYLQMSNIFGARGTYLTPSNVVIASSGFTNENLGKGSVIIGGPTVQGGSNQIASTAQNALLLGRVSVSNGVNRISGAGANFLIGNVFTVEGTNEVISAAGPAVLFGAVRDGLNQVNGNGTLGVQQSIGGTNTLGGSGTGGSLMAASVQGKGLNKHLGDGSIMAAFITGTGGTNETTATADGSLFAGYSANGGWNLASGTPSYLFAMADKGTNVASGAGALIFGLSTDTNTITASGSPSFIFAHANSTFGSSAATAANSFFIGAGDTNSTQHSFMVSYGPSNKLHVTQNGVGIGTNASGDVLKVNGPSTFIGSKTNLDLLASQFMATDANKREVSTLNGAGLTNITTTATNLYFPLLIETNAGAVMFLDLPVSSAATAGTEQSYTFNVAGTAMLKLQRNHSSAGATTNAVLKTMAGFATNSITDFVIGTRYTNTSQRAWVGASVQLTAAVAGTAIVTLYCEQFQSVTNKVTVSAGPLASLITVEPLTMITSPQAVFYFLDEKTGAGASVAVVAGTCSRIEL